MTGGVLWSAAETGFFSVTQTAESAFSLVALDTKGLQNYTLHSLQYRTGIAVCLQNAYRKVYCVTSTKEVKVHLLKK